MQTNSNIIYGMGYIHRIRWVYIMLNTRLGGGGGVGCWEKDEGAGENDEKEGG